MPLAIITSTAYSLPAMRGSKENFMTTFQQIALNDRAATKHAHIIQSDAEALEIAHTLAEQYKHNAILRDAERILPFDEIEAYSQC